MGSTQAGLLRIHGPFPIAQYPLVRTQLPPLAVAQWQTPGLAARYERSWGVFFESFEEFLTFSWPVITVTDCGTGKAHIVTRMTSIGAFLKMIKTRQVLVFVFAPPAGVCVPVPRLNVPAPRRFGETLPLVDNILRVTPFETSQRHLRTISEYALYKKLYSTLPAAVLASQKQRVRDGEAKAIQELWQSRDKTFLALGFEWSERNNSSCLEWGYAAVRCSHLEASVSPSAVRRHLGH